MSNINSIFNKNMDLIFDKNFHLILFIVGSSFIYLNKPSFLGKLINNIFHHTVFIFCGTFYFYYRSTYDLEHAFVFSLMIILILKCMENYEENFTDDDGPVIINLNNDDIIVLQEGIYELNGKNKIPEKLLDNINNIISFSVNDNFNFFISKKGNNPQNFKGKRFIQTINYFDGVSKIEITKNN
jgi:hypothetical protein